jgi:hypothetical protein
MPKAGFLKRSPNNIFTGFVSFELGQTGIRRRRRGWVGGWGRVG